MDDIEKSYDEHVPTNVGDMESSHDELKINKRQKKRVFLWKRFLYLFN